MLSSVKVKLIRCTGILQGGLITQSAIILSNQIKTIVGYSVFTIRGLVAIGLLNVVPTLGIV